MVLHYRHRVNQSGRVAAPVQTIQEATSWLSRASQNERWDLALELKSNVALRRACERLGVVPETHCTVKILPLPPTAKAFAIDLYCQAHGGPIEIHGGTEEEPAHIFAQLPEPKSPGLDDLALDPQLVHLHTPSVVLTFSEGDMHRRYHVPAIWKVKKRIRQAYETAAGVAGFDLSFDQWSREATQVTRRPRESMVWTSHIGEFPYNVGVQAGGLRKEDREALYAQWLEVLGEIRVIEASLKAPLSELDTWIRTASNLAEKVTGNTWGVNTLPTEAGASSAAILEVLGDEKIVRQVKTWELRVHRIRWKLSDQSLNTEESENAVALVQESKEFHQTIHLGFPIEDMDSPRFQSAVAELQPHVPANLRNLLDWELVGDPGGTPRGKQVADYLERLRKTARNYFARHPLGPSSAPLMDSRGRILRRVTDRQEEDVAFKQTVIRAMQRALPEFDYSESTSWSGGGIFDFVRRNPSGTRNWIVVSRDKYGGAFGVDAAASAFPCAEVHLDLAGEDPSDTVNPGWGVRGLLDLMDHAPAGVAWTWIYKNRPSLETGLAEATDRVSRILLPLCSELEPVLVEMRSLGRQ